MGTQALRLLWIVLERVNAMESELQRLLKTKSLGKPDQTGVNSGTNRIGDLDSGSSN